ncbi:hypothetical protein BJ138DRAFT_512436 [Hygrophoropsis aurantiaca]|uniref:Uncharacterized protein n=1 Tax=Hygrophoropsis aurantiaca TaxID=72124 RepID=A0ACB8A2V4_9AGAM|nr:hypothetical protein BJ138DRAFT_512436 [Hygrophoropsis aurantiaca]
MMDTQNKSMFERGFAVVTISCFTFLAIATPGNIVRQSSQCTTGLLSCCSSVQSSNSNGVMELLSLIGIVLGNTTGDVSLNCSSITPIGTGNVSTCAQGSVCCTTNEYDGLVNFGCSQVNLKV